MTALTSKVSHPPTILRPRPKFPLLISMVVSLPATTGQVRGSEVVGADPCQSDLPMRQVCVVLKDEEEEEENRGVRGEDSGEREQGRDRDVGRGSEVEEERLSDWLMESLTAT